MSDEKKANYRDTLNLPETSFAMKANLVQRGPQMRRRWDQENLYTQIRTARLGSPLYVLHDGPPYANGDIHMGHVINKVLKDFVVKYKTMAGFDAPYIPGWDCHGLPIESRVMTDLGERAKQMSKAEVRRDCMKYASKYVKLQTSQFQTLGVFGDFANPYLTFKPQYEAGILEVFAELVGKGLVYKQLKPIHWCVGCETALAEAELEYRDIGSPSIFVNFPATDDTAKRLVELGLVTDEQARDAAVCFMIWTTTPWTLAANLAIAVHPQLEYVTLSYEKDGRKYVSVVSTDRVEAVAQAGGRAEGQYALSPTKVRGDALEGLRYRHPFIASNPTDKDAYMLILADYVTTEDGTGLVHTAPGHGMEDYMSGQKYGLAVYSPVQDDGSYDQSVPEWLRGKSVLDVDKPVNDYLAQQGWLFAQSEIRHSYPHCWRSKDPVIFRATEQWFISVDKEVPHAGKNLRQMALESCTRVRWIPTWGQKRIAGMLESRPDWCISRQRSWGLPIPVFVAPDGRTLLTKESVLAVSKHIAKRGSDSWFTDSARDILGDGFALPDGFDLDTLGREENIFDVWFESGCSWYSVARAAGWPVPVDLYLEGSDQHRGWFQLSLLPALGAIGTEPFKSVLTHGFTVDEKGMKQSKSLGNYVNALDEVNKYGADILRLWVASVNYQEDIRCNDELIGRTQDAYRKIRNTLRYLLGNLDDFEPALHALPYDNLHAIDRWAMQQLQRLIADVTDAYDNFVFHRVFGLLYNFCTVQMSSIYLDVLKDRLYCDGADSISRRSAQTVMYEILGTLVRLLAPILAHTAEEAWDAMKFKPQDCTSVHLALLPKVDTTIDYQSEEAKWQKLMDLRDQVLRALEGLRQDKTIASNQEATVTLRCTEADAAAVEAFGIEAFAALCIVSEVKLQPGADSTAVTVAKSAHAKCQRCWNYWLTVGADSEYPDICQRCASVVRG
ncbi:MAG: isoleucine--tRNA ligase [Sedimentisphaerales bacterium]|nr:isoleucine--tRNA ligase [Sedimentisphaerales bacterium]